MLGWMYILECVDGSFYTGSTNDLNFRLAQHALGIGANFTSKRLPFKLVYVEEFSSVELAFEREKQIQRWRREKKIALISKREFELPELSIAYRDKRREGSKGN